MPDESDGVKHSDHVSMSRQGSSEPDAALDITVTRFRKLQLLPESGRMAKAADCLSLIDDRAALAGMRNERVLLARAAYETVALNVPLGRPAFGRNDSRARDRKPRPLLTVSMSMVRRRWPLYLSSENGQLQASRMPFV